MTHRILHRQGAHYSSSLLAHSLRVLTDPVRVLRASSRNVTNDDKIALGLRIENLSRSPIPAPRTAPLLMITGARSGTHELRYADESTPSSRRKPPGAIHLQLSMVEGDAPATNPDDAKLVGLYTKQPVIVEHDAASNGKTATYFARWVTRRGLLGPWSLPVSMTIAFSGGATSASRSGGGGEGELRIAA